MPWKVAGATKAGPADNTDGGRRVCLKAGGHGAHAQEHEFARVLKDRPDDFLTLDAELIDTLSEVRRDCLRRGLFAFHHARGLPNSSQVSTRVQCDKQTMRQ